MLESHPPFPASIMDGYAVIAPLAAGTKCEVIGNILAGDNSPVELTAGKAVYITTGARLPQFANAVVKVYCCWTLPTTRLITQIEDTTLVSASGSSGSKEVVVGVDVKPNAFVRAPGCDISAGEVLLEKGEIITSATIGVLATCGLTKVLCFPQPVVGVMSTGNELVEASSKDLVGSQVI